jgi:hypothetical protein
MDASLPPKGRGESEVREPSLYPTASKCQSGSSATTTEGKEGSR